MNDTSGRQTTVLLADDHLVVRMGIATIISFERDLRVVAEADTGTEAVQLAREHHPDVIVMDLMMPKTNGVDATVEILHDDPSVRILILTTFGTSADLRRAVDAGVKGAIVKTSTQEEIIDAIRRVAAGERVFSPEIEQTLAQVSEAVLLSPRQLDVIKLAAKGFTNGEIGEFLHIGVNGVKDRLKTAFARLGAVLAHGEEVRELLVVHPIETVFGKTFSPRETPENEKLIALTDALLSLHLDFDFGDEKILSGMGKAEADILKIGKASYRAVLIPECVTLRRTTLELLKKFSDAGGKVFYLGNPPCRIDGEISSDGKKIFAKFHWCLLIHLLDFVFR